MTTTPTTWADIRASEGLESFVIVLVFADATSTKEWNKADTDDAHWARLVAIAETSASDVDEMGFSWVNAVVINGKRVELNPPAHLHRHLQIAR